MERAFFCRSPHVSKGGKRNVISEQNSLLDRGGSRKRLTGVVDSFYGFWLLFR